MKIYKKFSIVITLFLTLTCVGQGFEDNFSKEALNEVPSKWSVVKGEAVVALVDEKKTFALQDNAIVTPRVNGTGTSYLGDDFTIEFDLFFDEATTAYRQFYKLRFWEGDGNYGLNGSHTDPVIFYRHGIRVSGSADVKSYIKLKELEVNDKVWRHIKIVYKDGALSMYINDNLLYSNTALFYKPKMISFGPTIHNSTALISAFTNFSLMGETENNNPTNSQINFNKNIDGEAHEMLKKLLPKGIQSFSFAPNGGWVIITKTNEHFARNIPGTCYEKIKEFVQKGTKIKEVVFPPNGGINSWLIITENGTFSKNIPGACYDKITALQKSGKVIESVAFPYDNVFDDSNDAWSIITTDGDFYVKNIPDECYQIMRNIRQTDMPGKSSDRKITKVSYGPGNKWVVMAEDYFFFMNMPQDYIEYFNSIKAQEYSPEIIAFDPDKKGWSITSDKATPPTLSNLIRDIENNISNNRDIWQIMSANKVPGVAIAVVINGKVAWKTAYGHLIKNDKRLAAHPESMFQAASISKVFAALGAFKLIDGKKVTLTENLLTSGKLKNTIPFHSCVNNTTFTNAFNALTIENILQHRSGVEGRGSLLDRNCNYLGRNSQGNFTGGGYGGFEAIDDVPMLDDLIKNITITYDPNATPTANGLSLWYSGKAFTVLQKLTEDVTNVDYDVWMKNNVLNPLEMEKSAFTIEPEKLYGEFARAHNTNGTELPIQRYPQYAAAGLYTNAEELANLIIMINNNGKLNNKYVMSKEAITNLIDKDMGINVNGNRYSHGGTNTGFRALFTGFRNISQDGVESAGIVVLTNGHNNIRELITNAIRREYGW